MRAASVRFESVTKAFGDVVAVDTIDFLIEAGTLVTLLGPSGCGKTTTLRLIAGLELPTAGRILIGDHDVSTLPATSRDVTMVFQSYALFPHMTVLENVAYGLTVSGVPRAEAAEKAEHGLSQVNLAGYGPRLPSELSGGQQQRVAVARALVLEPAVLLFDEPLSNLDAKLRRRVRQDIRDLQQALGLTTVYVTHDQEEALAVSDRIIVMNQAVVAQDGSPRELYEEPADRFVADFIGDANLVEARVTAVEGDTAVVDLGGLTRRLPGRGVPVGEAAVAIRPEAIAVELEAAPDRLAGEVEKAIYLGGHVEYDVRTAVGTLFVVDHRTDRVVPEGNAVHLDLAARGVTLVPTAD